MQTKLIFIEESTIEAYRAAAKENQASWEAVQEYKHALRLWQALYVFTLALVAGFMAKHWNVVRSWF